MTTHDITVLQMEPEAPNPQRYDRLRNWFAERYYGDRLTVSGLEHLPAEGPAIIAPNHRHKLKDVTALAAALPRQAYWLAKEELDKPVLGRVLKDCGALYVNRDDEQSRVKGLFACARELRMGRMVVIFSEGTTRLPERGVIRNIYESPAQLAIQFNAPLVPVGIGGTDGTPLLRRSGAFNRGRFHVAFGEPIDHTLVIRTLQQIKGASRRTPARRYAPDMTAVLRDRMQEMFDYAQAAAAGEPTSTGRIGLPTYSGE